MSERTRRETGRGKNKVVSALEKLKKVRAGEAHKRDDIKDEEDVYEMLDEDEYSELIHKRQKEDWIVNDAGETGYYEDGREIFDDYEDGEAGDDGDGGNNYEEYGSGKQKKKIPLRKAKSEEHKKLELKKKGSIKSFLCAGRKETNKKKTFDNVEINDQDLLDDILKGINSSSSKDFGFTSKITSVDSNKEIISKIKKRKHSSLDISGSTSNNPFSIVDSDTDTNKRVRKGLDDNDDDDELIDIKDVPIIKKEKDELKYKPEEVIEDFTESMDCLDDEIIQQSVQAAFNTGVKFSFDGIESNSPARYSTNLPTELEEYLQFTTDDKQNKFLNFYWIDAYEDVREPGVVYLFGKVFLKSLDKYVSCCFVCQNIERKLFVYPRNFARDDPNQVVTMQNVHDEIRERLQEYKIKNFRSKPVTKFYAFEKDLSPKAEYLEVLLDATRTIPSDLQGNTFKYVFGTNQSSMERFLLELKLKGPCWLTIKNPEVNSPPISWCKVEFCLKSPFSQIQLADESTTKQEMPPLTLMAISLKTYMNPHTKQNEILSISCLCNRDFYIEGTLDKATQKVDLHFCLITKPSANSGVRFPYDFTNDKVAANYRKTKVEVASSERELLNLFLAKLCQIDADILVGHDIYGFDFDTILSRIAHFKIMSWSKIGRIKKSGQIPIKSRERANVNCGRLICDVMISSKELIKAKSFDLTELTVQVLKKQRTEFDQTMLPHVYESSKSLLAFVESSMLDADHILNIMLELNILPLALQITKIAGNLFSRTLLGGRSERNEFLLLHSFNEHNYIVPDKYFGRFNKSAKAHEGEEPEEEQTNNGKRKKAAYSGGLVLDPKVGFYDKYILLMDFNSLYPSIIQEYNICFTTVDRKSYLECSRDATGQMLPELPDKESTTGILPVEISRLVTSRREVKKQLCNPDLKPSQKIQLDIKQKALKLTANSMYGCLGFSNSRFYAKPLAALITSKGRDILSNTKQLAESIGLDVIYGDTDSIMINTNSTDYDEARKIGTRLQSEINRTYKLLEIEIDGVFRSILLLKKKKYAAVVVTKVNNQLKFSTEVKGLDIVRRDWSNIARKVGEHVLHQILSFDKPCEQILDNIHSYLKDTATAIREKQIPLNMFVITKQLTKNPEDYPDSKSLSHVVVALRRNKCEKVSRKFKSGNTIPYVICVKKDNADNFNSLPATQRAFHVEELKEDSNLEIDVNYYLQSQIHPIVSRLCDPIDGTNTHVLAEFLGIEAPHSNISSKNQDLDYELLYKLDETRYDTCKPLVFQCPNKECNHELEFRNCIQKVKVENSENQPPNRSSNPATVYELSFKNCPYCKESLIKSENERYLINQLRVYIRSLVNRFYQSWMTCEDPICKYRTRNFGGNLTKNGVICPECRQSLLVPDISDVQLHLQLSFFIHIFEIEKELQKLRSIDPDQHRKLQSDAASSLPVFKKLITVVNEYKNAMAYDEVDLDYLFNRQYFTCVRSL